MQEPKSTTTNIIAPPPPTTMAVTIDDRMVGGNQPKSANAAKTVQRTVKEGPNAVYNTCPFNEPA